MITQQMIVKSMIANGWRFHTLGVRGDAYMSNPSTGTLVAVSRKGQLELVS